MFNSRSLSVRRIVELRPSNRGHLSRSDGTHQFSSFSFNVELNSYMRVGRLYLPLVLTMVLNYEAMKPKGSETTGPARPAVLLLSVDMAILWFVKRKCFNE